MTSPKKKDKGCLEDIRVKFDYRLIREKSPDDLDDLRHQAQLVAYDIYEHLGWKFHLEKLMVGFSYAKAMKSSGKKDTLFFSIDWASSSVTDNVKRRTCIRSEQRIGIHSYHSWNKMWRRYVNETLSDILTVNKTNPLFK